MSSRNSFYSLWSVFTSLDLGAPASAEARATHICQIVDHVSRTAKNDFAYPSIALSVLPMGRRTEFIPFGTREQWNKFRSTMG